MDELGIITKNDQETRKVAELLAGECLRHAASKRALVLALEGNLGGGKTTFVQGLAKKFGIKERITSPTFVLMKIFKIPATACQNRKSKIENYKLFIHIDAYRLSSASELEALGWQELTRDPQNIIVMEWADKVRRLLPKDAIIIKFKHLWGDEREIIINQKAKTKYQNHVSKIKNKPLESVSF